MGRTIAKLYEDAMQRSTLLERGVTLEQRARTKQRAKRG
jgi:hypothetical protein